MTNRIGTALALSAVLLLPACLSAQVPNAGGPNTRPARAGRLGPSHEVMGRLTAAAGGSYTVTPMRKTIAPVTFTLSPRAKISKLTLETTNDLKVGQTLNINGTISADGKSVVARVITVVPAPRRLARAGARVEPNHVNGTVATTTPLVVSEADGTQVTVTAGPGARVMSTAPGTADDLTVNSLVRARVTTATPSVASQVWVMPAGSFAGNKGAGRGGRKGPKTDPFL